jgi:hypothetical protein
LLCNEKLKDSSIEAKITDLEHKVTVSLKLLIRYWYTILAMGEVSQRCPSNTGRTNSSILILKLGEIKL